MWDEPKPACGFVTSCRDTWVVLLHPEQDDLFVSRAYTAHGTEPSVCQVMVYLGKLAATRQVGAARTSS